MTMLRALMVSLLVLCAAAPAFAVRPDEVLADPALEARARALSSELRCLVCQNQSIDDSDAPLARDLRILVRERLKAGDDDAAIRSFLVARYGDFVLLRPPLSNQTLLLWSLPFLALAAGALLLLRKAQRPAPSPPPPLSSAEQEALKKALEEQ